MITRFGLQSSSRRLRAGLTALSVFTGFCFAIQGSAQATEGGGTQWALGVQTIAPAILPPPGATEYYDYFEYYHANSFKGANGKSSAPGFDLNVEAQASRIVHTWTPTFFGLNISSGIIATINNLDLGVSTPVGPAHQSRFGLNYLIVTPIYLTYGTENLHLLFGPEVFIPTAIPGFKTTNLVNSANNYASFNQELAVTYYPIKQLELSAEAEITVNGTNPANDYHSGADINIDFAANYAPLPSMPNLFFGINGNYTKQFTDDTQLGALVNGGNRLRKVSLGGQVIFFPSLATAFALKYQREFAVRNGPEGDKFWLQFAFPL